MYKFSIALLAALVLLAGVVHAQTPTRVRGIISHVDGNTLSVKSDNGKSVSVQLAEKTEIVFTQPIKITDIQQGDFLGVTSSKREDGSLTAFEIRRFPKPVNPGHRPFAGHSDQTMTNATVAAMAQSATGRELTVTYEGGSQKIVVPENASISMLVPGERSQLKPGAAVNLTALTAEGGKLTARRIQVSPLK
jgi:hypothetical protein